MLYSEFVSRLTVTGETKDGILAVCPAHDDRPTNPHLLVTVSDAGKLLLHCRVGCEKNEILARLQLTMRDLATVDVSDAPAARVSSARSPAGVADIAALAVKLDAWAADLDDRGREYVHRRFGLSAADAERLGLGSMTHGGIHRIVVPFRTIHGVSRGYQGRDIEGTHPVKWLGPRSPEDGSWSPLAWFSGTSGDPEVFIVEGPGDGLTAAGLGYDTIAVAGASNAKRDDVADEIADWTQGRPVVLCGDGDQAGRTFNANLSAKLTARGLTVRVLPLPEGADLSDRYEVEGAGLGRTLIRAIAEASPVSAAAAASSALELQWDEKTFALTDLGAARYLRRHIESTGSAIHVTPEAGVLLYRDGIWERDTIETLRSRAHEVADVVRKIAAGLTRAAKSAAEGPDRDERAAKAARYTKFSKHLQTTSGINAMVREVKVLPGVGGSFEDFDTHPYAIAYRNGWYDIRDRSFNPLTPEMKITMRFDFDRDPQAKAPRWHRFLEECHEGKDVRDYLRRVTGYGLTGYASESILVVHWGPTARNGKSTFLETIREIAGAYATTTKSSTFEKKSSSGSAETSYSLAKLKGVRYLVSSESNDGSVMDNALIKSLTGNEAVEARVMYQMPMTFTPQFLANLAVNHLPKFRGQDPGLWERIKLVTWNRHFRKEERDKTLLQTLLTEKQGIALWIEAGASEWWDAKSLSEPESVANSTLGYKATNDALSGFYADALAQSEGISGKFLEVLSDDPAVKHGAWVTAAELYASYKNWALEEGLGLRDTWLRTTLIKEFENRGLRKDRNAQGIIFRGIRRATEEESTGAASAADVNIAFTEVTEAVTTARDPRVIPAPPSLDDAFVTEIDLIAPSAE